MDPTATLARIRELIAEHDDLAEEECYDHNEAVRILFDLSQAIEDLDRWLSRGGFLPVPWTPSAASR